MKNILLICLIMMLCSCCAERQQEVFSTVKPSQSDGNVVFFVSNQSGHINPVDMDLYVDDILLATAEVPSGPHAQYSVTWVIEPGRRKIRVTVPSIPGLRIEREIDLIIGRRLYLAIDFYFSFPDKNDLPIDRPMLKLIEHDIPPPIL
jgi:hypothetical protein